MPLARTGHSSMVMNGKVIIFGGILEVTKEINDVHAYDISTGKWELIEFPVN
jgi:N-acetylneuraminic acid mutarotase